MTEGSVAMPPPMRPEAFQGPLGEFVYLIEETTEADPAAILLGSLVAFGNAAGRSAWYPLGGGLRMRTNLYALVVGETSLGRKGTAWRVAENLFRQVDEEWFSSRIRGGLSSGEGLVFAVRDGDDEGEKPDPGVEDKRLMVREDEFVRVLEVGRRTGNTLSSDLRSLWTSGRAGTLTRKNALTTTDAHVSLVADITAEELRDRLDAIDLVNGLLNRFVPILVRISRPLAYSEDPPGLDEIVEKVRTALRYASNVGEMGDAPETRTIWPSMYEELIEPRPGAVGGVTARGSDHVRKMAMIYALADRSVSIRPEHLRAARAVWDYAESSVEVIFGIPPTLDEWIARLVEDAGSAGLTRTDLRDLLGPRPRASEIDEAVERLEVAGTVISERLTTGTRGRPKTLLVATSQRIEIPT